MNKPRLSPFSGDLTDFLGAGGIKVPPSLFLYHTGQILAYCLIFELFCLFL